MRCFPGKACTPHLVDRRRQRHAGGLEAFSARRGTQGAGRGRQTIRGIEGMDIIETSAVVADGRITEYHTRVRIRFRIER